jgi:hypothetical protein
MGSFHKVSRKYLPVAEFTWRYNNRSNPDIFGAAIALAETPIFKETKAFSDIIRGKWSHKPRAKIVATITTIEAAATIKKPYKLWPGKP